VSDINETEGLKAPDPVDFENYDDAGGGGQKIVLPPRGVYSLLPTEPPKVGKTKDGYLQVELTPLELIPPGTPWEVQKINYTRVNTKKWPNKNANGFADYLRSHGYDGKPTSNEEYQGAAEALVGHPAQAVVDWEAYCKECRYTLKGMEKFPKNEDGTYEQRVKCPNCSTAENPKWIFANARVVAFVPPGK